MERMTNYISYEYFMNTLQKIIKAMKCDRYLIMNDKIIGSNSELSCISVVYSLDNNISGILDIQKDYLYDLFKTADQNMDIYTEIYRRSNIYIQFGRSDLLDAYNRLLYDLSCGAVPDCYISNLKQDEKFNAILSLKASAGAVPYNVFGKYILYIFPGVLGINKSDSVELKYYERMETNGKDIAEFIIDKKFCKVYKFFGYARIKA